MYEQIILEVQDPVAIIMLNRPDRLNATTPQMMQELRHALAVAERNEEVVGIVITGAGRGFCAGADMADLQDIQHSGQITPETGADLEPLDPGDRELGKDFERGLAYLWTIRKPIVAAINGPCAGYGFSLAMFCDLRFASESAFFTTAFAQRGLVAEHGMSWLLPHLIGSSRSLDVLWSGRRFDAQEALQLGVVNRVVPDGESSSSAQAYVTGLAETCSPVSLMHMKRQVYRHLMQPLGPAMSETEALMAESVKRPDFKEGLASYTERRPPKFERVVVD